MLGIRPVGSHAVLVEVPDSGLARGLAAWARGRVLADEIVPGAQTVLFDGCLEPAAVAALVRSWPGTVDPTPPASLELPVTYDGADLEFVARAWGMTSTEAAATHAGCEFVVAFCGFAPGFAYLEGLPAELALPRLATPRAVVPAGSLAVADRWTGLYPTASPGGWRLLGRTTARLWRPELDDHPALLEPGTRVRFVVAA